MRDPYAVLGLPHGADLVAVKARYRELALRHHPDKLYGLSDEDKAKNTELFKEITVAYQIILEGGGGRGGDGTWANADGHWSSVWERVEKMFQQKEIWSFMGDVLKDVASKYRTAQAEAVPHVFDLTVGLRDVYENKPKKLRLFLKGLDDPVIVRAYCGSYPEYRTTYASFDAEYDIRVRLRVREEDTWPYTIDTLFGTKDLYTEVTISWAEAITGVTRELPYLSGGTVAVVVPPFWTEDGRGPIVLRGFGATGHSSEAMYVSVRVRGPTEEAWRAFTESGEGDNAQFLKDLARLSAFEIPSASHENPGEDVEGMRTKST